MANLEKQFYRALESLLSGMTITLESGRQVQLPALQPVLQNDVTGNIQVIAEPLGPNSPISQIGKGAGMTSREKMVAFSVEIYHQHHDEKTMVFDLMDIAWTVYEAIIEAGQKIGGAESVRVLETSYDRMEYQKDKNNQQDTMFVGMFIIPVIGVYRR